VLKKLRSTGGPDPGARFLPQLGFVELVRAIGALLRRTAAEWWQDKAPRRRSAIAFYAILSLAPFLVIAVGIAGLVYGGNAVGAIQAQFDDLVGAEAGHAIGEVISHTNEPTESWLAALVGLVTLLVGASGVFGALQGSLDTI